MIAAAAPTSWFPWDDVLETGLGLLRLSPAVFWAMTPREFAFSAGLVRKRTPAPERDDLQALMARFPDI
ncbi:phage tail assembly chaperone [Aliihoeflea aestuarii]|uniref:rcc01693 family protein n=1 Tax=Aliihoeflea aestuarii TaxID=453840 RepID=UPI0020921486|nr:rcc01693 family protein [Aliihoeflea aestuarii]MCO6389505.1 phage tail assembly chaperone [Aliihoeflea aestuarii]